MFFSSIFFILLLIEGDNIKKFTAPSILSFEIDSQHSKNSDKIALLYSWEKL